jgi:hypothetical protein
MASAQGAATFSVIAKDAASSVLRGVGKEIGSLGKTGKAAFKTLAVFAAAAAAAITAAAGMAAKFAKSAIQAAIADQAEQAKLIAVLEARGLATDKNRKAVEALIKSGQELAFTDGEIRAGIGIATQFTNDFTKAQKILAVAQDVSRAKNISLEAATNLVGKAFAGNGTAAKKLGIDLTKTTKVFGEKIGKDKAGHTVTIKTSKLIKDQVKGQGALNAISAKFGGVAEKNARTASAQFSILGIKIGEAQESIGGALLPAVLTVFDALQPIVDQLLGDLEKRLPELEAFANTLADEIVGKLPGFIAAAKEALPGIIQQIKDFVVGVVSFGTEAVKTLGPNGLVTVGLVGIGTKIGGLAGGLAAAFTKGFSDIGFGPFESLLLGTITGAVVSGVVTGLASSLVTNAIAAFGARITAAGAAGSAAAAAKGAAAGVPAAVGGAAALGVGAVAGVAGGVALGVGALALALQKPLAQVGITGTGVSNMSPMFSGAATGKNVPQVTNNITLGKTVSSQIETSVAASARIQSPSRMQTR